MGRSWSILVFILNGQFPDGFPQDEDPVPFDANPHPINGVVNEVNPNAPQGWQHDLHGAAQNVHQDFGLNANNMAEVQDELMPEQADVGPGVASLDGWDDWLEDNQAGADNQ
jgi:hypothetical protein